MGRTISQRELRNESGEVMRAVDRGESFTITRNGVPVAELMPIRRSHFISREAALAAFSGAPAIDYQQMRAEIDAVIDPDPTPRY
jgi:prevent-host-death family protein